MDRANRSPIIAATSLALPIALLLTSFSVAQSPSGTRSTAGNQPGVQQRSGVQQAAGNHSHQGQPVRQVAGQQDNQTRPGLLQVLTGSRSRGSSNHQHQNMASKPSRGILDALFSRSGSNSNTSSRSNQRTAPQHRTGNTRSQSTANTASNRAPQQEPDWTGVPYHGTASKVATSDVAPLRDPGDADLAEPKSNTRIVRGGSTRTLQAIPASSRRSGSDTSGNLSVPRPPRDVSTSRDVTPSVAPVESQRSSLSTSSSSRRSGRRSVTALSTVERKPTAKTRKPQTPDEQVADLVPRRTTTTPKPPADKVAATPAPKVSSKPAPGVSAKPAPASSSKPAPNVSAKPAPKVASKPEPEVKEEIPSLRPAPVPNVAKTQPAPQVQTLPSKPEAKTLPKTQSVASADVTAKSNDSVAQPGLAAAATQPEPSYTTPSVPSTTDVANSPQAPTAPAAKLGTPAAAASHRSGPPHQAFSAGQITNAPSGSTPSQPRGPQFNAASTPVGSGVAANGGVASYRRASQPTYEVAENPQGNNDPYRSGNAPSGRAMATNGQRMGGATAAKPTVASPGPAGDDFSRATPESRRPGFGPNNPEAATSTSELPGIRVTTVGPKAIMIRQNNQYQIRVENRGSIDASGVLVRAVVPDWADVRGQNATLGQIENQKQGTKDRLVWTIDSLPAGASETMFVRLTAERSGTYELDVDWTLLPQKSTAKVQVREPRLDLTIEGPDEVVYGQSQTYKVRVLNPGDGTAPNVVFTLSPNSATPQSQRIGDIPPGKEAQFDVELTAQDLGDLKIHGLAAGDLELRAESQKTIRVASAKLEAVLSGPEVKYQNTEAMYSLQVQNDGTASSEKIVAVLRLPSGVKYLGGIDGAVQEGSMLRWEINEMVPGADRSYQFRCTMASTGEHLFSFDCKGTAAGTANVSIATRVESIADLVLTVTDPAAPAPIGTDVTYEIVIRNRGSKEATNVRAVAQFSHGIEPQRIEGQSGEVVTGQVLFDSIPRIGAGQEVRLKVVAQAENAGHHRFRTEVTSGDTVLVAEEATHYMSPKSDRVSRRSSESSNR